MNTFEIGQHLRAFIRGLRHRPIHLLMAVSILALGLTASIAVFTYINGFYQPFPGVDAGGLVRIFGIEDEDPYGDISFLDFTDYAAADGVFSGIAAAHSSFAASVRHETLTEVVFGRAVSGNFFSVLDIGLSAGRGLSVEDDRPESDPAAVISHSWWQRRFNGERSVVGSVVYLNYKPFTVVGVASPEFLGSTSTFRPDVWIPTEPFKATYTGWAAASEDRELPLVQVYGRLLPGASRREGLAALQTVAARLDQAYPGREKPRRLRVDAATWIDPRSRLAEMPTVRLMVVAASGFLLLVCANVANLLIGVAFGRRREMALRAALGASRGRILRQILTENILLSAVAGGIALFLAGPAGARLGSYFARPSVWGGNVAREANVDLHVVAFALGISLITGLLAGILPALWASRRNLADALKTDAAASIGVPFRILGRRMPGARDLLVVAQVALSVVLLVVAGLVVRTLAAAGEIDPGFSYDHLVASYVSTSSAGVEVGDRERFFREISERLTEEPWVRVATVADQALLSGHNSVRLRLEGQSETVSLVHSKVIPGFFEALRIEILRGRAFLPTDVAGAQGVAIVNESLARRFFAGKEALGRRLWWPGDKGEEDRMFEIVGVARDVRSEDFLAEPEPMVYFSQPQHHYSPGNALLVSTNIDPAVSVPYLHRWLRDFETHIAIVNVLPYTEVVRGFLYAQRMNAELFSALALFGLALAAVGIFSVMSLLVAQRRREIGIRMAIGARRLEIGRLILGRALIPVLLGLGIGLSASFAMTRLVRGLLYGVEPADPLTLAGGTVVLVAAALLAAYLPAHRAATLDPVAALRCE